MLSVVCFNVLDNVPPAWPMAWHAIPQDRSEFWEALAASTCRPKHFICEGVCTDLPITLLAAFKRPATEGAAGVTPKPPPNVFTF